VEFDVAIVGARIAGSTLAALLGRAGLRVLLLDSTRFPSDTFSTHVIYGDSFGVWREAGCWDDIENVGAEPLAGISWHRLGAPPDVVGHFLDIHGFTHGLCLRRLLLDDILFRNAADTPGVTALDKTRAVGLIFDDTGRVSGVRYQPRGRNAAVQEARATLVVGADGRHSFVADAVGSPRYSVRDPIYFPMYAYARDIEPIDTPMLEIFDTKDPGGTMMLCPCDDGIWLTVIYTDQSEYEKYHLNFKEIYWERLRSDPRFSDRLQSMTPVSAVKTRGDMVNFMRAPVGNGWALVGDSGQFKDPIYGQGIGDAARTAKLLTGCVAGALQGERDLSSALAEFQAHRDRDLLPNFEWMILERPRQLTRAEFEEMRDYAGCSPEIARRFVNIFSHAIVADEFFTRTELAKLRRARGQVAESGRRAEALEPVE
jgi:2-polyprenyl-6-methoxyphenol hydroxylase-like FAD-dependent oxidoreductase